MHERHPPTRNLESLTSQGLCIRAAPGHTPQADEAPYGGEIDRVSKLPNYRHLLAGFPYWKTAEPRILNPTAMGDRPSHDVFVAGGWGGRVATGNDSRSATHLREATSSRLTHSPSNLHCRASNVEARCGPLKVDAVRDLCARHEPVPVLSLSNAFLLAARDNFLRDPPIQNERHETRLGCRCISFLDH
jgi:hypothetical protein